MNEKQRHQRETWEKFPARDPFVTDWALPEGGEGAVFAPLLIVLPNGEEILVPQNEKPSDNATNINDGKESP